MTHNFNIAAKNYKQELKIRLENDEKIGISPEISNDKSRYELSERISAIHCGGIGIVNEVIHKSGLVDLINDNIHLLKVHKPYHESDHILNIAYNIICGGNCLEDIELLRNNIPYLNALGAERIPDPTTAGDFLRRFDENSIFNLIDIVNQVNQNIWNKKIPKKKIDAILDIDSTIHETYGECKEKMDISYKGKWGFHPLVITEANTGNHLYAINRSGNRSSNFNAGIWIDRSIEVVKKHFRHTYLRGDTAFSLTNKFDDWDTRNISFVFGYDNHKNLILKADSLPDYKWKRLKRYKKASDKPRKKKKRVKQEIVESRGFKDYHLKKEYISEFSYRPVNCGQDYRVVVVKKVLDVKMGQELLFEECRYFFYITNIYHMTPAEVVKFINGRANHENKIEQLKNGVSALKMPASEFLANQAYIIIASLAWNIKSWIGLLCPDKEKGKTIIKMEFKRFQNSLINIPCQILNSGRYTVFRLLNYNSWVELIYRMSNQLKFLQI